MPFCNTYFSRLLKLSAVSPSDQCGHNAPSRKCLYSWMPIKFRFFYIYGSTQNMFVDGWITWYLSLGFYLSKSCHYVFHLDAINSYFVRKMTFWA